MHLNVLVGIDRDGTIIEDSGNFPGSKEHPKESFTLRPGVIEGLMKLRRAGEDYEGVNIGLAMISNQSGPARYKVNADDIPGINEYLNLNILSPLGVTFDDMQYCEHVPSDYERKKEAEGKKINHDFVRYCADYKPATGMLMKSALNMFNHPLYQCLVYMIGDRPVDVQTGINAKGRSIFVQSNVEEHSDLEKVKELQAREEAMGNIYNVRIAKTFDEAADIIVGDLIGKLMHERA